FKLHDRRELRSHRPTQVVIGERRSRRRPTQVMEKQRNCHRPAQVVIACRSHRYFAPMMGE
ncbi:hypothetical protein LINGRAHAP2_LOCUS30678, partial [Linum grandiflorum]